MGYTPSSQDRQSVNLHLIALLLPSRLWGQCPLPSLFSQPLLLTSFSRYWLKISVSFKRVTLHFPLQERDQKTLGELLMPSPQHPQYTTPPLHLLNKGLLATVAPIVPYRMWVAGNDSNCRERKSSRCFS